VFSVSKPRPEKSTSFLKYKKAVFNWSKQKTEFFVLEPFEQLFSLLLSTRFLYKNQQSL